DLIDIINNIGLVRAFGARERERERLSRIIAGEMDAQRDSLRSLERLRLAHAVSVFLVTAGVHAWRDFAMAMVDLVQQFAKLGEAVRELGQPHEMPDAPHARPLINLGGSISFLNVCFSYPDSERVLQDFTLHIRAGQRVGLVGRSGAGKSTVLALL